MLNASQIHHFSRFRFLPYRIRRSILKRVYPQWKSYEFDMVMEGGLRCFGKLENYIDRLIFFCGAHEKYMLYFLRDTVEALRTSGKSELRFLDVGANIGNHSMYMAKLVDEVYAFEPFPRVFEHLKRHKEMNGLENLHLFPFALGEENTILPFYAGGEENLGAASFHEGHVKSNHLLGELEVRRGDEVFAAYSLKPIHLVKIDVEGFEPPVLRGLKNSFDAMRPLMIVELTPTTRKQVGDEAALKALFPENYQFFYFSQACLDSGKYALAPFRYDVNGKTEDIIAVPEEMAALVPGK